MFCQRCGGPTEQREHDGRLRPVCTSCDAVTYLDPNVVVAVIIERDDRILLGKRAVGIGRVQVETQETVFAMKKAMGLAGAWNRIRRRAERHGSANPS